MSKDIDMCRIIKKRRESMRFRTTSKKDNINLAYAMSGGITPGANIAVSDRSSALVQNRQPNVAKYVKLTGSTFYTAVGQFLVTDVFTTELPTRPATPLFYKHQLQEFNSELADFAARELLSYGFTDIYLTAKTLTEYSLDTATGYLYNNIENWYDSGTTEFDVTFIVYTVRYTDPLTEAVSVTTYHELISNSPIFIPASFDDLDEYGRLVADHDVYLVERLPGGVQYEVSLPTSSTYAYREIPESRIYVEPPDALDAYSPWYISVTNGKFLSSQYISPSTARTYQYYLPEWDGQLYNPYPPYTRKIQQRAIWITDTVVKVPGNIVWPNMANIFTEVLVFNANREIKYAYTNDPDKIDVAYSDTVD